MLDLLILLNVFILLAYGGLLYWLSRKKSVERIGGMTVRDISVIIPFKNEADVLPNLLGDLSQLDKLQKQLPIYLVNDHSSDHWKEVLGSQNHLNCHILDLPEGVDGKKQAIQYAVSKIKTDWFMSIDADTRLPEDFFSILFEISLPKETKFCQVPLKSSAKKGLTSAFFDLEFLSLHFTALQAARGGMPLLANAACILIDSEAYRLVAKSRKDWDIASGDDVFTMFAVAKEYGNSAISAIHPQQILAQVEFPTGFKKLWNQRLRWISKTHRIPQATFSAVALLTLGFNLCFLLNVILAFSLKTSVFIGLATVCFVIQALFLRQVLNAFKRKDLMVWLLPSIFIYPFYLLSLLIGQLLWKPKWK